MREFKVGDRVFDIRYRWGTIERVISYEKKLPVIVVFDDAHTIDRFYTKDGAYYQNQPRALYYHDTTRYFPRNMEVSNDGKDWSVVKVFFVDDEGDAAGDFLFKYPYYREIEEKQEIVELTIQDISEGKGVGVDPKLIRIKK
jgi:hypothetical protein